jgi:hypothetical protein
MLTSVLYGFFVQRGECMRYQQQDELVISRREDGLIGITSTDYNGEETLILLNDDAARFVIRSLQKLNDDFVVRP